VAGTFVRISLPLRRKIGGAEGRGFWILVIVELGKCWNCWDTVTPSRSLIDS
jgi:hypothetical protein